MISIAGLTRHSIAMCIKNGYLDVYMSLVSYIMLMIYMYICLFHNRISNENYVFFPNMAMVLALTGTGNSVVRMYTLTAEMLKTGHLGEAHKALSIQLLVQNRSFIIRGLERPLDSKAEIYIN